MRNRKKKIDLVRVIFLTKERKKYCKTNTILRSPRSHFGDQVNRLVEKYKSIEVMEWSLVPPLSPLRHRLLAGLARDR